MSRLFQKFRQDIVGILLLSVGLFVGLALLSFNPTDPSFNSIGNGLKVTNYCGYVGSFLADALFQAFGISAWLFVIGIFRLSYISFQGGSIMSKNLRLVWASLLILTLSCLVAVYLPQTKIFQNQISIGGIIGLALSQALIKVFNPVGVQVILWGMAAVFTIFFSEKSVKELTKWPLQAVRGFIALPFWSQLKKNMFIKAVKTKEKLVKNEKPEKKLLLPVKAKEITKEKDSEDDDEESNVIELKPLKEPVQLAMGEDDDEDFEDDDQDEPAAAKAPATRRKVVLKAKVQRRIENWELPKISLLEDPPAHRAKVDEKEIRKKADLLTDKLSQFSVTGEVVAAKPGPAVTLFEFKPSVNVRVSKITELADDLSLALSSESLRIIAPIPGRDVVGIETSNAIREIVYHKDLLADDRFWSDDMKLPIALGKQVNGDPQIVDLRRMPHLMIAGTTGSGKSVFTVAAITGLLFKHSPKTLRLILIDPKQVDLAAFEKIPHLIMPTVTDTRQAVNSLKWAVKEMEKRYNSMKKFGARDLEAYNQKVSDLTKTQIEEHEKALLELESTPGRKSDQYYYTQQPYIVIVVEEFGDLMTVEKANVETAVVRLAQKARAAGIHLILAMQSPRKEVVTGMIKTNIPGRISFKVNSSMDSRIILDETGADRLLAQGDMLYKSPGGSNLIRHHGPYLKDSEINAVAQFWSDQAEPEFDPSIIKAIESSGSIEPGEGGAGGEFGEESYDERYDEILSWASQQKEISASLIQRRFQLGYPRAARIVETFEREGVVGPANGSKPRQVLVQNLNNLMD